jgi:hypothetical protein
MRINQINELEYYQERASEAFENGYQGSYQIITSRFYFITYDDKDYYWCKHDNNKITLSKIYYTSIGFGNLSYQFIKRINPNGLPF